MLRRQMVITCVFLSVLLGGCAQQIDPATGRVITMGPTTTALYENPTTHQKILLVRTGVWNTKFGSVYADQNSIKVENWTSEEKMSENMGKLLDLTQAMAATAAKAK